MDQAQPSAKDFIGLVIGALLGLFLPKWTFVSFFGTMFVSALKAIAPILVFILVLSSLASSSYNLGKKFRTVIILYMLSTLLAALIAVGGSFIFPVTMQFTHDVSDVTNSAPQGLGEVINNLLSM